MSLYYYINNESDSKTSINDYEEIFYDYITKTPTLTEALMQMFTSSGVSPIKSNRLINEIISRVNRHLNEKFIEIKKKYPNISKEEAQIISSYTYELENEDSNYNIYKILNKNLVSENREMGIMAISKYLFIFLKSLRKLKRYYPDKQSKYLYRCISTQVELNYDSFDKSKIPYLRGETKIFWGFSSASNNPKHSYNFLGKQDNIKFGTIFTLTGDVWGYDIKLFNIFDEDEILLEPERKFMIKQSLPPANNVIHVRCKILETPIVLEKIFELKKNNLNQNKINASNKDYFNTINTTYDLQNLDKYYEPDLQNIGNLNINNIINSKNENPLTTPNKNKQKILFHSNSAMNVTKSKYYINSNNAINNSSNNKIQNQVKIKKIDALNSNKKDNIQYINNNKYKIIKDIKKDNNNFFYTPIKKDTQFKIYESSIKTTNSDNHPNSSKFSSLTYNNKNPKVSSLLYSNSEQNLLKSKNTNSNYNVNINQKNNCFNKKLDNINIYKKNENNALLTPIKKSSQHIISYSNNIKDSINYTEPNYSKYSNFPKINIKSNNINSSNLKSGLKTTNSKAGPKDNINYFNPKNNKVTLSTKINNNNIINKKKDNIQYINNNNFYESNSIKLDNLNINNILNTKKENNNYYHSNLLENKKSNNKNSFGLTYSNSEKNIIKKNNFDNLYKNPYENNYFKETDFDFDFDNLNINKIINNKKEDNKNLLSNPIKNNNQHIKYNSFSNYSDNLKKPSYNPVPYSNYNNHYYYDFNENDEEFY